MNESEETKHERHRRSIRLSGYDYSQNGAYFITICTRNRENLFGEIENGEMRLNDIGRMIERWWYELGNRFPDIELDAFVVMPNHAHGIIVIRNDPVPVGAILCNRPVPEWNRHDLYREQGENIKQGENMVSKMGENMVSPLRIPNTYDGLGRYVSWFKRMSVNEYIRRVKMKEFPPFEKSIWQRNYYEHIIRNDRERNLIAEYIEKNPERWEEDVLYIAGGMFVGWWK